jgi:hypothetical protein
MQRVRPPTRRPWTDCSGDRRPHGRGSTSLSRPEASDAASLSATACASSWVKSPRASRRSPSRQGATFAAARVAASSRTSWTRTTVRLPRSSTLARWRPGRLAAFYALGPTGKPLWTDYSVGTRAWMEGVGGVGRRRVVSVCRTHPAGRTPLTCAAVREHGSRLAMGPDRHCQSPIRVSARRTPQRGSTSADPEETSRQALGVVSRGAPPGAARSASAATGRSSIRAPNIALCTTASVS